MYQVLTSKMDITSGGEVVSTVNLSHNEVK
jgi:hypothetical protein